MRGLLVVGFVLIIVFSMGRESAYHDAKKKITEEIRREAVREGVARYVADDEGNVRFEWIKTK